ncbi:hypothetical protein THAOC_30374, partial [Thalassiosira oceanica]
SSATGRGPTVASQGPRRPKARDVLAADTPRSGMYAAAHRGKHYVARKCAPANITPRSVLAVMRGGKHDAARRIAQRHAYAYASCCRER